MIKRTFGLYRTLRPDGMDDDATVSDGHNELVIDEPRYRARGYEPEWEDLPWRDDYFATQAGNPTLGIDPTTAD